MTMTKLKQEIIELCNKSGLSIEAVVFVLKDAYRDAEDSFIAYETRKSKMQEEEKEISSEENIIAD